MTDLNGLYQELILDHNKRPRNYGRPAQADRSAEGYNPLCGDRVTVYVQVKNDIVEDVHFEGTGCAISTASASLMTEALKGKTKAEAEALFASFHDMVTGIAAASGDVRKLGKLAALSGVCEYPTRVKCATLVWHTLRAALHGDGKAVTTE